MALSKAKQFANTFLRLDAWKNERTGQNTAYDKNRCNKPFLNKLSEEDLETAYRSDDIAERIINKLPEAAFNHGFDFMPNEGKAYEFIWSEIKRLHIEEKVLQAWKLGRLYGNAALILEIEDGQERDQPVDWNRVKHIRWSQVLENRFYDVTKIGSMPGTEYYRKPEIIRVQSTVADTDPNTESLQMQEFHASRVIFFDGKEIPWNAYQDNNYSHDSLLQRVWDKIANFDSAFGAVSKLLPEVRQSIYKMPGWAELVASGKQDVVEKRISDLNQLRSVYRMLILDSEEEIESNTVPLSGIEGVLAKLEKRVVQASGMPHTIVLGEGSQGSTSGRTETEDWAATVAEAQNSYLKPKLEMVAKAIMSQTNAPAMEQDSNGLFEIHFKPVITKRDSEKVAEYKTTAEADSIYASLGVISPEDIRNRFSQDGFRYDIQLEEIDEELIEAELPEPQENLDSVEAFIPPNDVATAASKGLAMRKQYGRGGTEIGVARARDLKNQKQISLETIARMVSFFARHEQNKKSTTESGEPGNGMIAWELWGGDAGKQWAEGIWKRTQEKGDQSDIQTLVFSKGRFKSKEQVIEWIRENGFKQIKEIDETESSWRVRQVAPADFKASSFRTVDITEGVKAVIGELQNY